MRKVIFSIFTGVITFQETVKVEKRKIVWKQT